MFRILLLIGLLLGACPALADGAFTPGVSSINGCTSVCATPSQFVSGFTTSSPGTTANLMAQQPCNSGLVGQYAVVSDLYAGATATNEVLRCGSTGSSYYWRPQRTDYTTNVSTTGGNSSFTCLVNAPTTFFNGTLATNLNINLQTTNCWPGARFEIASNVTLGVFGVTVTGLTGGVSKILGASAHYTFTFDGTGWQFYQ